MIGIPYNYNNCIFITSQTLNADQFNSNVPNAGNITTHNMLWDTVANSIIWVDTKTNLIVFEITSGGGSASWALNGNVNGVLKSIGTLDNFDFPIICNGIEIGRFVPPSIVGPFFSGDGRFFLGQTVTDNGSNAGAQSSCTRPNRAQWRFNQYGANGAAGGFTTFKSRNLVIGAPVVPADAVIITDIIQGQTAIAVTNNGLIPIAYTQRVIVVKNANGSVACDWEVSLCPLSGTTNSIRKAFGFTSEGIQKTLETANGMSGLAILDAAGQIVVANTNVKASTKFMLTVQDGGAAPTGMVFQSARVNGTSFTIKSNAGAADVGVQVYYQLYEPIV